jgi:hypothetical protein
MAKRPVRYVSHFPKWAIHSLPHLLPLTIAPLLPASQTIQLKAIDMRFYWIRDCVRQGQFQVYWGKGSHNKADYFTKHHPASHHKAIRSTYLHSSDNPTKKYFDCLDDTTHEPIGLNNVAKTATKASTSAEHNSGEGVLIPGEPREPGTNHSSFSTPLII